MSAIIQGFMWGIGMIGADRVLRSETLKTGAKKFWSDVMHVANGEDKKPAPKVHGEVVDFATGETLKKGKVDTPAGAA